MGGFWFLGGVGGVGGWMEMRGFWSFFFWGKVGGCVWGEVGGGFRYMLFTLYLRVELLVAADGEPEVGGDLQGLAGPQRGQREEEDADAAGAVFDINR